MFCRQTDYHCLQIYADLSSFSLNEHQQNPLALTMSLLQRLSSVITTYDSCLCNLLFSELQRKCVLLEKKTTIHTRWAHIVYNEVIKMEITASGNVVVVSWYNDKCGPLESADSNCFSKYPNM